MNDIQKRLTEETFFWYDLASEHLGRRFEYPEVSFDLKGTCAGMAYTLQNKIKYNLGIARDNLEDFSARTVPHEVAHCIAEMYYNKNCGHGPLWKRIMKNVFGVEPVRCHDYDVTNHRARKRFRYVYNCACNDNCVCGPKHHKKVLLGSTSIVCRLCRTKLTKQLFLSKIDIDAK